MPEQIDLEQVDVVIVGAGPTGLTAAHLCQRLGLSAVVLERREGPQRAPAAHAVNARTFEIWRQAGVEMQPLLDASLPPEQAGRVHWVTKLGGQVIGSLPYERQGDEMLAITPTPLRNLSQHRLEPLLLSPDLEVRYGHGWRSAEETEHGVTVQVDGPDGGYQIEASYLLGADGAASSVRRSLDIESIGPRTIQSFLMVHLGADFRSLVGEPPGVLYFAVDPASGGTFVSHGADREWVYMHPWDAGSEAVEAFTEERCDAMVRAALADESAEFEILGVSTWHMSAQIAERYGRGRTFLVGDAAHRFPPTGGLGLNTGVADAHNLIWKLAAVKAGWASVSMLDTYESERRPVAQFNCDQSLHNAFKLVEVPAALGFTDDVEQSTTSLCKTLQDPVRRAAVEGAIANQAIHFDLLGLQLGYSYEGPLVMADGSPPAALDEPARDYEPSTRPGGRLPHAWLADGRSTLDLIDVSTPTVLVRQGAQPDISSSTPSITVECPAAAWDEVIELGSDTCLIVRPDQHVAYRGPHSRAGEILTQLFDRPEHP